MIRVAPRDDRATIRRTERFLRHFAEWLRRPTVWADPGVRFLLVTDPGASAPLWSWREARLEEDGWRVTRCRTPSATAFRSALAPAYRAEGMRLRQRYLLERGRWYRATRRLDALAGAFVRAHVG